MRCTRTLALAALVLGFAAFSSSLYATGSCADCPHFGHAPAPDRKPAELYLSPDPEPPRL